MIPAALCTPQRPALFFFFAVTLGAITRHAYNIVLSAPHLSTSGAAATAASPVPQSSSQLFGFVIRPTLILTICKLPNSLTAELKEMRGALASPMSPPPGPTGALGRPCPYMGAACMCLACVSCCPCGVPSICCSPAPSARAQAQSQPPSSWPRAPQSDSALPQHPAACSMPGAQPLP